MWYLSLLLAVACISNVHADLYLHVPRGSNNRLNEKSANRKNADRLFDSQNNNRGGYNAGDATDKPAGGNEEKQYRMSYFQSGSNYKISTNGDGGTYLTIEWTNQHGCGGNEDSDPHKLNCNLVLQYMCQQDVNTATGPAEGEAYTLRNGVNTGTQNYNRPNNIKNENEGTAQNRRNNNVQPNKGLHESHEWYDKCYVRERNKGLFTADQILKNNNGLGYSSSIYTRQNPNGNRRGYECPEERDYYPYWHPTPWKDIAVLAENQTMCQHYETKSFNVQPYHECLENFPGTTDKRPYSRWNNATACTSNNGRWLALYNYLEKATGKNNKGACERSSKSGVQYKWAVPHDTLDGTPQCLVLLDAPECTQAPWTRSNHLGNGREPLASTYTWKLPYFPSGDTKRCVFRMRYNISTDDYDPYNTDSSQNNNKMQGIKSPVQQNPYVDIGASTSPLRLAINTAQLGRTFQDRSHVFKLQPRTSQMGSRRIYNLNVRGKRGNIVQVYPAVEYDFAPNSLEIQEGDLVHVQWTGSNTHNNGNPAGDGQAGDAGEGTSGTDRSNMVEIGEMSGNYPLVYEQTSMWTGTKVYWSYHGYNMGPEDLAVNLASSGYYQCRKGCAEAAETKGKLNNLLNNAPASYGGTVLEFRKGSYHYICTRNNNFTNRSQKAKIVVKDRNNPDLMM